MSDTLTDSSSLPDNVAPIEEGNSVSTAVDTPQEVVSIDESAASSIESGDVGLSEKDGIATSPGLPPNEDASSIDANAIGVLPAAEATPGEAVGGGPAPAHVTALAPGLKHRRRPHTKRFWVVTWMLLAIVIVGILVPAIFAINYGISASTTYTTLRNQAYDGVQHLLNVKTIFIGSAGASLAGAHASGFLDVGKLHRAQTELAAAHKDFQQVAYTLTHAAVISTINEYLPQYRPQITAARAVSKIGMDVAEIGQKLVSVATVLAPTFRGPLLNNSRKPLVTPAMLVLVRTTIDYMLPRLSDIQTQSGMFSLSSVQQISAHQRDQLTQLLQAIPQAQADLTQVRNLLDAAGWMLGVNEPRTFLVQTMDRAELRPTGGFTGQLGELSINGGRVAPFALKDISLIEYTDNSPTLGLLALPQYRSWWPFANWGLRDSNLSADFPTSAKIAISKYKSEVGHRVDGVIIFTPFLIEHVLQVVGPIQMPGYNDTITAQNLEERLHYYQQDSTGLAKQAVYQSGDKETSSRKRFTALLARLLLDKVRHAPPDEILAIARQMLHDLKTKDLQVYVTNPQIEGLLVQYGDAAQIDRSTEHDGLYVVQANVSASKASQYVRTILHDTVTLQADGSATHVLNIRLVYSQLGPVYGYDTYHDYIRVYVPPTSKYLWGDGFDTGKPLCGAYLGSCPQSDVYPKDELLCPVGQFQPGAQAPSITDSNGGRWHPLDTVGPPTNLTSDEPGRAMFGGWVIVPKNCTMTVTLSWNVPAQGQHHPYTLLVQRQAGMFPELDLTLLPTPGDCAKLNTAGQHFDGILGEDTSFSLQPMQQSNDERVGCYPQPGV